MNEGALCVGCRREPADADFVLRCLGRRLRAGCRVEVALPGALYLASVPPLFQEGVGDLREVLQELAAVLGADRFGVELHAPEGPLAVAQPHQEPVLRPSGLLQTGGQLFDYQRVVAHGREGAGDVAEEARAVVVNLAQATVHRLRCVLHAPPVDEAEPLMPEADAEQRHLRVEQQLPADAEVPLVVGAARPRRDHHVVEGESFQPLGVQLVVLEDERRLPADLRDEMEQVEGEGVIIVDYERFHVPGPVLKH